MFKEYWVNNVSIIKVLYMDNMVEKEGRNKIIGKIWL